MSISLFISIFVLFKQLESHVATRYKAHLYIQIKLTNMTISINFLHN